MFKLHTWPEGVTGGESGSETFNTSACTAYEYLYTVEDCGIVNVGKSIHLSNGEFII